MARRPGRRSAALSALRLAFVLGLLGSAGYAIFVRGQGLFHRLTLREALTVIGVIAVLWLIFWPLFAVARRRSD
jgi:hypothetical protein